MKDDLVERLAEIIDPRAFKNHRSLYDHCLSAGDDESEAKRTAEWAHGKEIDAAMYSGCPMEVIADEIADAVRALAHTNGQEGGR